MTRIAIIGSSHVGAVRMAQEQIETLYQDVSLTFFAMTAGMFQHSFVDDAGVLQVPQSVGSRRERLMRINNAEELDLTPFDHIWIIGPRFSLHTLHRLFLTHGMFGQASARDGKMMLTWNFFEAAVFDLVDQSMDALTRAYGSDPRITVTPAPMPSEGALKAGPFFDRPLKAMTQLTRSARIASLYENHIAQRVAKNGWRLLAQPKATRVQPFVTHDRYAFRPEAGDKNPLDYRHMGANYGLVLARAYLTGGLQIPANHPTPAPSFAEADMQPADKPA